MSPETLNLLNTQSSRPDDPELAIEMLGIEGVAYAHLHQFPDAESALAQGEKLCSTMDARSCGHIIRANGVLAVERGHLPEAQQFFQQSLSFARSHGDQFLAATALLNLGLTSLQEGHFDEAVDQTEESYLTATAIDAGDIAQTALGNLGWAYYNLGDADKALDLSLEAEKLAIGVGDVINQVAYLNNAGYVYAQKHDLASARSAYEQTLGLAHRIGSQRHVYNALRALALVSLESGDLAEARKDANEAIRIAQTDHNRMDELYPLLVTGFIAARSNSWTEAEHIFREVDQDKDGNASLRWRAQHGLARLYQDEKRFDDADREYRASLATFEAARSSLRRTDSKLPFSSNAYRIYDDYVDFLTAQGKTNGALRWADYSRARTLGDRLGLMGKQVSPRPEVFDAQAIARRAKGTLLFYWLGEKRSYLWLVTPKKTTLFPLPAGSEINAAAERYRKSLTGPLDVLAAANRDGTWLYTTLVAPAQRMLPNETRFLVIPDGSLNNLNFETLIVSEPRLHYWIEDATVSNVSSLRLLAGSTAETAGRGRLLLIGNSVAPNKEYPELPKAPAEMESVASHFQASGREVLSRDQATPAAYLSSHPEQFSYIHFVAHGTANRLNPLDSAIVLSRNGTGNDSFKLYARDIIRYRLQARLVTISACYGAGERSYSGEGLVGLSWAFLKAGAHEVVAALWEVSDTSTEQLMGEFYDELDRGTRPEAALRAAKLSLLHSSNFRKPFYWAPFQLYAGL